jgi:hypothetical protein
MQANEGGAYFGMLRLTKMLRLTEMRPALYLFSGKMQSTGVFLD